MDPIGLCVGTLASCVVTEMIKALISCTQAAVKCKSECKKMHEELVVIMPDVEKIEKRLAALRQAISCDAHDDLQMVDDWLRRLKNAIETAKNDVYRCNSGRFSFDQHKLSVRLTAQHDTITRLAQQRQTLFLHLRNLMPLPTAQGRSQGTQVHPPPNWYESPGDTMLRRMTEERNDALRRAELHRQSLSSGSSSRSGWSYGFGGYESTESSGQGGYQSEADSSGHGGDSSPGAHLLRQKTQQRDVVSQQAETERQLLRRHTMTEPTAAMASAFGHEPLPAYDKWKY